MADRSKFIQSTKARQARTFSEDFKREKVREIESKGTRISEICKQYEVTKAAVYNWVTKYSSTYQKSIRTIVETESDTKKLLELQQKIAELERLVGQKQILLDFKDKMIELAEEQYGVDIKKKFEKKLSSGSGSTEKS